MTPPNCKGPGRDSAPGGLGSRWVGPRSLYHTSWKNNDGRAFQAEGTASAKSKHRNSLACWNWKKAPKRERATGRVAGDGTKKEGRDGRIQLPPMKGLHEVPGTQQALKKW